MDKTKIPNLTDDTLENITIMAPLLDEVGQNRVFGMMCGLMSNGGSDAKSDFIEKTDNKKAG